MKCKTLLVTGTSAKYERCCTLRMAQFFPLLSKKIEVRVRHDLMINTNYEVISADVATQGAKTSAGSQTRLTRQPESRLCNNNSAYVASILGCIRPVAWVGSITSRRRVPQQDLPLLGQTVAQRPLLMPRRTRLLDGS